MAWHFSLGRRRACKPSIFPRGFGPAPLTVGIGILLNQTYYRGMTREFVASRPLFLSLRRGDRRHRREIAIVLVHNVWVLNWRVLITLLGWINLLRGAFSILLPEQSFALGGRAMAGKHMPMIAGVFALLIGLTLSYFGYTAKG